MDGDPEKVERDGGMTRLCRVAKTIRRARAAG